MTISEWCPTCGANIVMVTRGIPSRGTCSNGHKTDRRDVLRRPPADPVAQELAALRAELAQVKADADMAQAALVERAADGLVNAFLHMRTTYAKEMAAVTPFDPLQAFHEKEVVWSAIGDAKDAIRALAPDAGVKALAKLRAERDDLRECLQGADGRNLNLGKKLQDLAAELAEARAQEAALRKALDDADSALTEAEAILGGEYGDHYGPLCEMMLGLRAKISALAATQEPKP